MDDFNEIMAKAQCQIDFVTISGMPVIVAKMPLGETVIIQKKTHGHTDEQKATIDAFSDAGIKWFCFHSVEQARRTLDRIVNKDRTRAEVLRLASDYTIAANAYENQDKTDTCVLSFDDEDEALRTMVEMMNFNERKSTILRQDSHPKKPA